MKLFALALVLAAPAFAADPPKGGESASGVKVVVPVSKAKFVEGFKAGLPDVFCAEKTFFRKCFETTQDDCKKLTATALAACLVEIEKEIPAQITKQAEGQLWGDKLGSCAGEKLEGELAKGKASASAECKDPNRWK